VGAYRRRQRGPRDAVAAEAARRDVLQDERGGRGRELVEPLTGDATGAAVRRHAGDRADEREQERGLAHRSIVTRRARSARGGGETVSKGYTIERAMISFMISVVPP
jgi:hypothetical protein